MNNINIYDIEREADVVNKIADIASEVEEELNKEPDEINEKRLFQLRYQQFIQGLKLQIFK